MDKVVFEKSFLEKLDKNFTEHSEFFNFNLKVFSEFSPVIFEINKCLILEFYKSAITLTNNLLERLLKLALIYNETGIGAIPTDDWNRVFSGPNKKYSSINLGNSIELCKKFELLTLPEKNYLFEIVRELMRNSFAHADSTKILAHLPDDTLMFQASFSNPTDIKPINLNQKYIPFMQAFHIDSFAEQNAFPYFKFVFNLVFDIENRLMNKL